VAANGGHLSQLVELSGRIPGAGGDALWVTFDSPQSRSLLAGRRVVFIDPIEERDVRGVCRGLMAARRLMRVHGVTGVISTGSGIALSFLPYAALRGIAAHYIESAARVGAPSLTGKLLSLVPGVNLYRQYPAAAAGRWKYAGSVFDGFRASVEADRPVRRLVVTLGSGAHGFRRLLDSLLPILPPDVSVLWQTGSTPVDDLPIEAHRHIPADVLAKAMREADAIIGHAGCGSALTALNSGRYPILIPREPSHGELVDNHQVELAAFLGGRGLALHRTPQTITFNDIRAAAAHAVTRLSDLPALRLVDT
jgi:UDP-N-acetylglucosamine transferase subunit ALG13